MSRHVSIFPSVDSVLREQVASNFRVSWKPAVAQEIVANQYVLEPTDDWNADDHDLEVSLTLEEPGLLSRLLGSLIPEDATLSIVCEWSSPDSSCRGISVPQLFRMNEGKLEIRHNFAAGTVRGGVLLTVQAFMGDPDSTVGGDYHALSQGARIAQLSHDYRLHFDGDGSLFPISFTDEPSDPLWRLDSSGWDDITYDDFSSDYFSLVVNKKHPGYSLLKDSRGSFNTPLFREVLGSWIALFIWSVKEASENLSSETTPGRTLWEEINENVLDDFLPASIASAAAAFITRGGLKTGSLPELMASARSWVDRMFEGVADARE